MILVSWRSIALRGVFIESRLATQRISQCSYHHTNLFSPSDSTSLLSHFKSAGLRPPTGFESHSSGRTRRPGKRVVVIIGAKAVALWKDKRTLLVCLLHWMPLCLNLLWSVNWRWLQYRGRLSPTLAPAAHPDLTSPVGAAVSLQRQTLAVCCSYANTQQSSSALRGVSLSRSFCWSLWRLSTETS